MFSNETYVGINDPNAVGINARFMLQRLHYFDD